jgi:hypothetical protein
MKHEEIITLVLGLMRVMMRMMTGRMCEHEEIITLVLGLMRVMMRMMTGRM